mmetsp:Transcript_57644/g.151704  ORF Transcript_57644/g.151704 Transcript_57644/m.151704 type:complete len:127 (+) Transcript_57644:41-421(+)
MVNPDVWNWNDDNDDDLQKALKASLAEAEAQESAVNLIDDGISDGIPSEVGNSYQRVTSAWERNRRIQWLHTYEALDAALRFIDHPSTLGFVNQMVPNIVSICVENCDWGQITEDRDDREDYSAMF